MANALVDKIRSASEDELTTMFCSLVTAAASRVDVNSVCDICPVADKCENGKTRFGVWLKESEDLDFDQFVIRL